MEALYPISTVSELTGVNTVTLRAWERRYGLIEPQRTEKGRRLYSESDVQRIRSALDMMAGGMTVSGAAEVLRHSDAMQADTTDPWLHYRHDMVAAIETFDDVALERSYSQAMSLHPVDVVTDLLLTPLLHLLGKRWADKRPGSVAEEHFFSVFMRNKLGARFHHRNLDNRGPKLVAACLPGENHEFGLLLFSLLAHDEGFRIVLLGASLPVDELPAVVASTGSVGVVLSGSSHVNWNTVSTDLRNVSKKLPAPIFIGGEVTERFNGMLSEAGCIAVGRDLRQGMHLIKARLGKAVWEVS